MSTPGGDEPSKSPWRWVGRGSGALLALITLTTAAVGLLFTFVPGIKPSEAPERSATITQVTVEPAATIRSYLTQIRQLDFIRQYYLGETEPGADPEANRIARSVAREDYARFLRTRCISVYAQVRITARVPTATSTSRDRASSARMTPRPRRLAGTSSAWSSRTRASGC
jgi:hypothetical protein